jgi:hypothetical protein
VFEAGGATPKEIHMAHNPHTADDPERGSTDIFGPEVGGTDELGPEVGGTDILRPNSG